MSIFEKFGIVLLALPIFIYACGSEDDDSSDTASTLTYSDVSAFIGSYCAASGCHNTASAANGNIDLSTHAVVKTNAAASLAAINGGTMPKAPYKTNFDGETEGKANLIKYFEAGAPE